MLGVMFLISHEILLNFDNLFTPAKSSSPLLSPPKETEEFRRSVKQNSIGRAENYRDFPDFVSWVLDDVTRY